MEKLYVTPKKYKGETSVVSARLPDELIREIDRISLLTGRNRNEIIMLCLEFALENIEIQTS